MPEFSCSKIIKLGECQIGLFTDDFLLEWLFQLDFEILKSLIGTRCQFLNILVCAQLNLVKTLVSFLDLICVLDKLLAVSEYCQEIHVRLNGLPLVGCHHNGLIQRLLILLLAVLIF